MWSVQLFTASEKILTTILSGTYFNWTSYSKNLQETNKISSVKYEESRTAISHAFYFKCEWD